jgi:hypothetical protein
MVVRLALNVNIVARIEVVLDTKYNEFRLFAVMYLDLLRNWRLSEYEVCETGFMSSSVIEPCWYVEEPHMEKRSKSCFSSFALHLVRYMSWDTQRYLCCSFSEVFVVLLLSQVVPPPSTSPVLY